MLRRAHGENDVLLSWCVRPGGGVDSARRDKATRNVSAPGGGTPDAVGQPGAAVRTQLGKRYELIQISSSSSWGQVKHPQAHCVGCTAQWRLVGARCWVVPNPLRPPRRKPFRALPVLLLGQMVVLGSWGILKHPVFSSSGNAKLVSTAPAPFHDPTSDEGGLPLLAFSARLYFPGSPPSLCGAPGGSDLRVADD